MSSTLPRRYGLYEPETEHDACGVGFVAHIRGEKSRGIVEDALELLNRLSHRAAAGRDPETGDGAGILLQLPHRFFKREAPKLGFELPHRRRYGVAQVFLPPDAEARAACEAHLRGGGRRGGPAGARLARRAGGRRRSWGRWRAQVAAGHPAALHRPPPRGAQRLRAQALPHPQAGGEPHPRRAAGSRRAASTWPASRPRRSSTRACCCPEQLPRFYADLRTRSSSARWRWCTRASPPTPSPPGSWRSRSASSRTTARSTPLRGNRNWMTRAARAAPDGEVRRQPGAALPDHRPGQERLGAVRQHAGAALPGRPHAAARDDDDDPRGVGGPRRRWTTSGAPSTSTPRR